MAGADFDKLISAWNDLITRDKVVRTALTSLLSEHKKRIFESGQGADGGKIGNYSTKPTSISKKNQARDTGHTYFKGGYSQYKSEIGKNPGYVNLRNTDQLQMDYGLIATEKDSYGYGCQNNTNYDKTQWMEEKYNKPIFSLGATEQNRLQILLDESLKKTLEGNT